MAFADPSLLQIILTCAEVMEKSMDSKKEGQLVPPSELHPDAAPAGVDRRAFMMRSAPAVALVLC